MPRAQRLRHATACATLPPLLNGGYNMDDSCASSNEEEWRPVVGYEGWYEVSNQGRVKRLKSGRGAAPGRILKHYVIDPGYSRVTLSGGDKRSVAHAHHIVAKAFLGPRPPGMTINHIDGVKTNPAAWNLEYISQGDNNAHAYRIALRQRGENHCHAKLTEKEARAIRRLKGAMTQKEAAQRYGVSETVVRMIWIGKTWKHQIDT